MDPRWRHCGSCGTALAAAPAESAAGGSGPFDWRRPVVLVAVAVAVLSATSFAGLSAQRRSNDRAADLASTRKTLANTNELLATVRTELADRVKERDSLKGDLDRTKGSLTDAQRSVESQGEQLQTLKDCLNAIVDAGEALDRGDEQAARTAVDRAQRACSQAEAFL